MIRFFFSNIVFFFPFLFSLPKIVFFFLNAFRTSDMKSERPLEVGSFNQMIQCYVNELLILIFVWAAEDFNTTSQIMSKRVQIDYMLKNDKALITRKEARKKACYRHNLHLWRSPKRIIWKQPPLGKKRKKRKKECQIQNWS